MKHLLALALMSSGFTLSLDAHSVCDVCRGIATKAYYENKCPFPRGSIEYSVLQDATEEDLYWYEAGRICMMHQIHQACD